MSDSPTILTRGWIESDSTMFIPNELRGPLHPALFFMWLTIRKYWGLG